MAPTNPTADEVTDLQLPMGPSQGGTNFGFQVQARYMNSQPEQFGDVILDQRWKTLTFDPSPLGVPTARAWEFYLPALGLMNYESAQALRWWFLANCVVNRLGGRLCVETRIVQFKVTYDFKSVAESVVEESKDAWRKGSI